MMDDFTRHGVNLFDLCKTTDEARNNSKKFWGNASVFGECRTAKELSRLGDRLDGAHLYPAGEFRHIAKLPANIFPMSSGDHNYWDEDSAGKRSPLEKRALLIQWASLEHTGLIVDIIHEMVSRGLIK